ncbi:MAG TPA: ABC transporter substrate-binding protein [Trueperaceae bacterium]|jgi:neutral amino acid transport system substrate-binding protein
MKRLLISLLVAVGGVALAQETLNVGLLLPFTGQYDWVGANVQPVAQMIADEINESGGIDGAQVRLVIGDTEGTVDAGFTAAQKLINADGVVAIVGPTSLSLAGNQQLIVDTGTPIVSPTAGTTALDAFNDQYVFRTVPSDSLGGRAIARAATDGQYLGGDAFARPVLMVANAPAMISFQDPVAAAFEEYGTPVLANVLFTPGKTSYRTEVQEVLANDPDVIVLVATPEDSARVMQAAFQAGYEGTWFVTQDQTTSDYIELATPELVEGIYGLEEVAAPESADLNAAFQERYKAYSGNDVQIFGTNTYDAMNVVGLAMLRAALRDGEVTRETITANIRAVTDPGEGKVVVHDYTAGKEALEAGQEVDYQGLVGPIDFDRYGNITAPFAIKRVVNGEWTTVTILPAEALD